MPFFLWVMGAKKSDEQKQLQGTAKSSRAKSSKVTVLSRIPKPAFELELEAKKIFRETCKLMIQEKVLTALDVRAVTMFAFIYSQFILAKNNLVAEGMVQQYKSGATNVSGYFTVFEKLNNMVNKYFIALGLTPKHREIINAYSNVGAEDEKDPFVMMFEQIHENTN